MSNHLQLMGAALSPHRTRRLIVDTANTLLGDERFMASPERVYAAEFIGGLIERAHQLDVEQTELAQIPDSNYRPSIEVGGLIFAARTDMRIQYGDPQLAGVDCGAAPTDYEAAVYSEAAIATVRERMADVYVDQYQQ